MTFIEQFEQEFAFKLEQLKDGQADSADIVFWAAEQVLESYRNGITAGRKGTTVKRHGKSRRRSAFKQRSSGRPE